MSKRIAWQVTSLELSQKLKELGVKQKSFFFWLNNTTGPKIGYMNRDAWPHNYSAFTVAELGEMLPKELDSKHGMLELVWKHNLLAYGLYQFECTFHEIWIEPGDTEADARAKMLIYLIENGHVKVGGN